MTIVHNGAHIILWTLAAILQYLHRQNNESLISNGMFAPVFATRWSVCFVSLSSDKQPVTLLQCPCSS